MKVKLGAVAVKQLLLVLVFVLTGLTAIAQVIERPEFNSTVCGRAFQQVIRFDDIPGTTYSWVNDNPAIGLDATGTGNIAQFQAMNASFAVVSAKITVTPTAGGVPGTPFYFTITVNPEPGGVTPEIPGNLNLVYSPDEIAPELKYTVTRPTLPGAVVYWRNSNPGIGLPASGYGHIPSFTAVNKGTTPILAHINVTVQNDYCATGMGHYRTFTINPTPDVNKPADQKVCNAAIVPEIVFTGNVAGTTFTWTNDNTSIGLAASGSGNIASFTAQNLGNTTQTATITVTPEANGIPGTPVSFTLTVTPKSVMIPVTAYVIGNGERFDEVLFQSNVTEPVRYDWTNTNTTIGLAASQTDVKSIPAFIARNNSTVPVVATITVAQGVIGSNCWDDPESFTITVNPTPVLDPVVNKRVSNGISIPEIVFTSRSPGTTYSWTNDNTSIGLPASGTGNIAAFTALNSGSTNQTAVITVTPELNGFSGTPVSFTIVVTPIVMNVPLDRKVCNEGVAGEIRFGSATPGVTYSWTNDNTSIGLPASGTGHMTSFTAKNTGNISQIATIVVTPALNGFPGPAISFKLTVTPKSTMVPVPDYVLSSGQRFDEVLFQSNVTEPVRFDWTNNNTSIGLAAGSTNATGIPAFIATNAGTTPIVATINVAQGVIGSGCWNDSETFTITVNPAVVMDPVRGIVACNGVSIPDIVFNSAVAGTTYSWTNDYTGIGLAASGTGNIPSFIIINTSGNTVFRATVTVTPTANGVTGAPVTFTIISPPTPPLGVGGDQLVCDNQLTNYFSITTSTPGTTVSWTNDHPEIGLPASGTSRGILPFTAINKGSVPVIATLTVTARSPDGCENTKQATITVNPAPEMVQPGNQVVLHRENVSVNFSGGPVGTTYNWTVTDNPGIGLPNNSGWGDFSFRAQNNSGVTRIATLTVTPYLDLAACSGDTKTFTITVDPIADVIKPEDLNVANNELVKEIVFTSNGTGTTYSWVNDNTSIGVAASGTGNIPSFTAVNPGTTPVTATITVTPAAGGNTGTPVSFTITVNPIPDVNPVAPVVVCNGSNSPEIVFSGSVPGTTFNWVNNYPAIGLPASGTGNVPSFLANRPGMGPYIAKITVTPTTNGVVGLPKEFTITIPRPQIYQQIDLAGRHNGLIPETVFMNYMPGSTHHWTNDNPSIGLAASGTGNLPAFRAVNTGSGPVTATITVTSYYAGCPGNNVVSFTITVNPIPDVDPVESINVCDFEVIDQIVFTGSVSGTTYHWTNTNRSIGLGERGTGNIPAFTANNTGAAAETATITVTPRANGVAGTPITFSIKVHRRPSLGQPNNQTAVHGLQSREVVFSSTLPGANFVWTNDRPEIGLAASGTGNIPAFTVVNTGASIIPANIIVTAFNNGCPGQQRRFTISVLPLPNVNPVPPIVACNLENTPQIVFSSYIPATTYRWTNNRPDINLQSSGNGNINAFIAINKGLSPIIATITVTPRANAVDGLPVDFTITVNPTPNVVKPSDLTATHSEQVNEVVLNGTVLGTTYNWTNDHPEIGIAATGTGNIPAFIATNTSTAPVTATITVTPIANGCTGTPVSFRIAVKPRADVIPPAPVIACNRGTVAKILFLSNVSGTQFSWTNNQTAIGLPARGSGDSIGAFTAINTSTAPLVATITVTPTDPGAGGSDGLPVDFTITVNPTADVIAPAPVTACNGENIAEIVFQSNVSGTTYSWTNDNTTIGLVASGAGAVPSFTAINTGNIPVTATITVTPTAFGCTGAPVSFTITINPTADMIKPSDITAIHNEQVNELVFNSNVTGTTYSWINDNTAIGLAANGTGNLPLFTAVNTGSVPIMATVKVTPTAFGCTGTPVSFTITVNPIADVIPPAPVIACNQENIAEIVFQSNVTGTTYRWTNNNPAIGLVASGTGSVPSFTAVNTSNIPVTATITVTPTAHGADGLPVDFTITVNPTADVIKPADLTVAHNELVNEITLTSNVAGTTYSWTNDNPGIGLAANGTGNLPSFTAVNTGIIPVAAIITITPSANGCTGTPVSFTITVNPIADVIPPAPVIACNGENIAEVIFRSNVSGTTYRWTNDNTTIGLAANGAGNIAAFNAVNTSTVPVIATVTVTPTANGADGLPVDFTITVNPTADVIAPVPIIACNGENISEIVFQSNVSGTTYSWTNDNTTIGLGANGTGNIASFSAVNTSTTPVTATITVTPTAFGCTGTPVSFTITINPTADVIKPADITAIHNEQVNELVFNSNVTGTTYSWINDNAAIGLAANGTGNLPLFTAVNTGNVPVMATVTVTPTAFGCTGTPVSFTITVNPIADVIPPAPVIACNSEHLAEIIFQSNVAGTTYRWTNNNTTIGLAATGTGSVPSFTAVNTGHVPVIATITVTPAAHGADGLPVDFTITVNPTADVIKPDDLVAIHNDQVNEVIFSGNVAGTTYSWVNDNTAIGLAAGGLGVLPSFIAVNTGVVPVIATITVTPAANGCTGTPVSFTITVNPVADVIPPAPVIACNQENIAEIVFSSNVAGTTYRWVNNNTAIGLGANGTGNIASFNTVNTGSAPIIATLTVTPTANGADGLPVDFTITVNPTADVIAPAPLVACNTAATSEIVFQSNVSGTTYSWTNDNTNIGLAASGTGNIPSFTAINTGTTPVIATITVTPTAFGCTGTPVSFTITVNPTADVIKPADLTVAHNAQVSEIALTSNVAGTTYSWTNDNPGIGLAGSGSGNIPSFTAVNRSTAPVTATITVTPIANGCTGTPVSFTITVNQVADVLPVAPLIACNAANIAEIVFSSTIAGTTYRWTNNNTTIGLAAGGSGNIASFNAVNTSYAPVIATITVIPTANGADGLPVDFTITVNPTADVIAPASQVFCNRETTSEISFQSNVAGTTYSWTNNNTTIGLAANGTGPIPAFTTSNTSTTPLIATITVTPMANGCTGLPVSFTLTVNPTPDVIQPSDQTICNNATVSEISFKSNVSGTIYHWSNDNTSIGLAAAGIGNINAFMAVNTGTSPITARISVTPELNGCMGLPVTFTLTVNPLLEVITRNLNICGPNGYVNLAEGVTNYDPAKYLYTFYTADQIELTPEQVIRITQTGNYLVKSTDKTYLCESELATIEVGRVALPVVKINDPAATYAPFTIDLTKPEVTAGSDAGLTYRYYLDAATTQPLANPESAGGIAGNYTYYITGQNTATGCISTAQAVHITILAAPVLTISKAEINEGEQASLTIQLSDNAVLPQAIEIMLSGSAIKVPYQLPAKVVLPAGVNTISFIVTTQKGNVILKDQQLLTVSGQQQFYQVNSGEVIINDAITNNNIALSISDGRIFEQGEAELIASLPGNLITDQPLEVSLSSGGGTTLSSADYTFPAKVLIGAGQHEVSFYVKAVNNTGAVQKIVVAGNAAALGFSFPVRSGTVTIDAQSLIAGKVISDNADGINDYFSIENIREYPDNEVVVFNRWGQEVYRAKGYNNDSVRFDSRSNVGGTNGQKVPDGTYYYLITINKDGKRKQFKSFMKIKTQ